MSFRTESGARFTAYGIVVARPTSALLTSKVDVCWDSVDRAQIIKVGHVTSATSILTHSCIFWFSGLALYQYTKFEVSSSNHSRDLEG